MELVPLDKIESLLKDLKAKGKRIGRFGTTGKFHQGHVEGIRAAKNSADVVLVSFSDWIMDADRLLNGEMLSPYKRYRDQDLEFLDKLGFVDYVIERDLTNDIYNKIIELRDKVKENEELILSTKLFKVKCPVPLKIINKIALQLYPPPDSVLSDTTWCGDKDVAITLSAHLIAKKLGVPNNYKWFPVVRGEDGKPLSSRGFINSKINDPIEDNMFALFKERIDQLRNTGRIPKLTGNARMIILETNTWKVVETLAKNKEYMVLYSDFVYDRGGCIKYEDCLRIMG